MHFASEQTGSKRQRRPGELPGARSVALHSLARAEQTLTGAIRMVLAAQGALDRMRRDLCRMQDLAREADTQALEIPARVALHRSFLERLDRLARVAGTTEHAGTSLLDGSLAAGLTYVVEMDGIWAQRVTLAVPDCRPQALGLGRELDLSTPEEARQVVAALRRATARVQAVRLELGQTRDQLADAVEGLSRPTMLGFIQLHGAAMEHLRLAAAAMQRGLPEVADQECVLVGAILDIIASYSQSIAPGMCDNLGQLFSHLKQTVLGARLAAELDQVVPVLAELQHTWQLEVQRPLVVSGPNGRRHCLTTSAMRVEPGEDLEMVTGG